MSLPRRVWSVAAIVLTAALVRGYAGPIPAGVPFVAALDSLFASPFAVPVLRGLVLAGGAFFFLGLGPRLGCLMAGSSLVLQVLSNMAIFSNGRLFAGLLLILAGLHRGRLGTTFLRGQVVLLYLGAFWSKSMDPDWWNGIAVAAVVDYHPSSAWLADLPAFTIPAGWVTIAVEGAVCILLLVPAARWVACLLSVAFHTLLAVLLMEDFSIFYYAVAGSCLLFVDFPSAAKADLPRRLRRWARPAYVQLPDRVLAGAAARWVRVVLSPVGLLGPVALANLLAVGGHLGWRSLLLVAYAAALGVAVTLIAGPGARSRQSGGGDSGTSPAPSPASANGWDEADAPRMPNR